MSLSPPPNRETYWSRIRRWIVQNFQILIVSAVKICKQCLQIASFWGLVPQTLTGTLLLDPTIASKWKFMASSLHKCVCHLRNKDDLFTYLLCIHTFYFVMKWSQAKRQLRHNNIITKDRVNSLLFSNPAAISVLGLPGLQILAIRLFDFVHTLNIFVHWNLINQFSIHQDARHTCL